MGVKGVAYLPNSYVRYRRNLSDEFDESARDVVLAVERCLNLRKKWLERELSDRELFDCMKVCEMFEECEQEVNETSNEFVDKFERCYKLVVAKSEKSYIPKAIRACMIFRKARLTDTQRMQRKERILDR